MTHPIHKYKAIAAKWDEILAANDGGKLRRPITAEECCRMILAVNEYERRWIVCDCAEIDVHLEKAKNGV